MHTIIIHHIWPCKREWGEHVGTHKGERLTVECNGTMVLKWKYKRDIPIIIP